MGKKQSRAIWKLMISKKIFFVFLIFIISSTNLVAEEKKTEKKALNLKKIFNKEEEKPITLEDIDKLGTIVLLKKLPEEMYKELKQCKPYNEHFTKCESAKAGKIVGTTFRRKGGYGEKYPGKMMEAMAYFEILYLTSLYKNKKKN